MRIAVIAIGALLSSPAFADDPAILVCEAVIKTELKAPKSYERVSASVRGMSAFVSYDAVNTYNAPLRNHDECRFEKSGDVFGLVMDSMTVMDKVTARLAEIRSAGRPDDEDKLAELKRELASLEQQATTATARDVTRELAAQGTGLYPIPSTATKLGK